MVATEEGTPPQPDAKAEVAEADRQRDAWERGGGAAASSSAPFDLTVQPTVGGQEAAITLKGVTANTSVGEIQEMVHAKMESKPKPDEQRLFIVAGAQTPLEDETLPIGIYGVVEGVTLHLAMQDAAAGAARREGRAAVRQERAEAAVVEAMRLEDESEEKRRGRQDCKASACSCLFRWVACAPCSVCAWIGGKCGCTPAEIFRNVTLLVGGLVGIAVGLWCGLARPNRASIAADSLSGATGEQGA